MREIKFRAWDGIGNYGMCYYDIDELEHYFRGHKFQLVMQYIGIKDENGNEIYEGDIIIQTNNKAGNPYEFIGIVEYHGTGFFLKCIKGAEINAHYSFSYYEGENLKKGKIIGNICENPEFLNREKDEDE